MMDQESHISSQILEFSNANIKTIQSANTLFKFMKKFDYLQSIIEDKAIIPRYNCEDISYLSIDILKVLIPMICFCDINLHKIYPHTEEYGQFAIAFSKEWGIRKKIQPIQYINSYSLLVQDFSLAFQRAQNINIDSDDINVITSYLLSHLLYVKPLTGWQGVQRNFYDEKEWRYIPDLSIVNTDLKNIYTNPKMQNDQSRKNLSKSLKLVEESWLKF